MIDLITKNLPAILTALAALGIVRGYMKKLLALNKEVMELQNAIMKAMEDQKITEEELAEIAKEAKDIPGAVKMCVDPIRKVINKVFRR